MSDLDKDHLDAIDREKVKHSSDQVKDDLNADPITGEPGSHPVGTGLGSAGGAVAGAAIGAVGGPVGSIIGGVVGAIAGAAGGHAAAERVNPTEEDSYWREQGPSRDYYVNTETIYTDLDYDRDYQTAYRVGYENRPFYDTDTRFEDVEDELKLKWEQIKGQSRLKWEEAKWAAKDAWNRIKY